MKRWAAIIVLLLAAVVWAWRLLPRDAPTETELRRTAGVTAEVLALRPSPRGVEVACRVSNTTARAVAQVVLNVAVTDAQGRALAANPLATVADLPGGAHRDAAFLVPVRPPTSDARGRVEVSLVRWQE